MDNVVKKIAERFGEDILLDGNKLSSLIANYEKNKKTINLLNAAIRNNVPKRLYDTKSLTEEDRAMRITEVCKQFARDYTISEKAAYQAVNYFAEAFKLNETKLTVPKSTPTPKSTPAPAVNVIEPETPQDNSISQPNVDVTANATANVTQVKEFTQESLLEIQMNVAEKARIPDILTIITGLIIIFGLAIVMFIIPDQTFSEQENRVLQQLPAISSSGKFLDRLTSGVFTKDIANYYSDQLPLRDIFVGLKGGAEIALLKGENNGIILGKDNYLIAKAADKGIEQLRTNIDYISEFADAMKEMKVPVTLAAAGRSIDALGIYLPASYSRTESANLWSSFNGLADYAANVKRLNLLDPLKQLIDQKNKGQLYYRTDHHWTTLGAYYAYAEIIKVFNKETEIEPLPLSAFNITAAANDFYGTSWSKAGMKWVKPDTIYYFRYEGDEDFVTTVKDTGKTFNGFYDLSYLDAKDKYSSFISGNNARVDITKPGEPDRPKLLLVKDSFAHCIVPFLAYHYDLIIIDLRYYTDSAAKLVFEEDIDRVLFLHNIGNLSEDDTYGILPYGVEAALKAYAMDQYPIKKVFINGNEINDYVIVYPTEENERRQQYYVDAAEALRDMILSRAGVELEIAKSDNLSEFDTNDKVIILTTEGIPAGGFMKIATEGSNLVFRCNISDDPSGYAVKRFTDRYFKNGTGSFNFGENFVFSDIGDSVIMILPNRE